MTLAGEEGIRTAYRAHGTELYGFAARSLGDRGLAEEAVQETFVRAWRAAPRFDPELGSLRTWLFAIARNVIVDLARTRAARPQLPLREPDREPQAALAEPEDDPYERALLAWEVEEALRRLGAAHRQILLETYFLQRPHAEVAADLGIPVGTVKSRVYYALRALRNALEELGYDG